MAENKKKDSSGSGVALLVLCAAFLLIVLTAIFSSSHPLDFIVNFFATLTGYIFLIAFLCALAGVFWYYWKMGAEDPDKSISEAARDNLEYSRDVTEEIKYKAREFYADYKERVKEAEEEKKLEDQK